MPHRIEIYTKVNDARSANLLSRLRGLGFPVTAATIAEVYTLSKDLTQKELTEVANMLTNPISQTFLIDDFKHDSTFDFALEIGFLPGVTDNIATTAKESIEDLLKKHFTAEESIHSSQLILLKGDLNEEQIENIGWSMANNLIQRIHVKSHEKFLEDKGMDIIVPKVHLKNHTKANNKVDLNLPEEELLTLSREGVLNEDGTRRGPLALDKEQIATIKKYYEKEGRNPTDIELESLAQTWSEHCKHTIFAAKIDENDAGLYRGFIKKATQEIRNKKGEKDFCVSVFKDNSGGIIFDENWVVTDKMETHNSPSALDPFGGALTGIVGVNRDCIGFGKGAKPIINKYGFCVGNPDDNETIYRDKKMQIPALPPKRILQGVVAGVNAGGNCSGIPTPQGFVYFHDCYKGKPLVFAGTVGLIPKEINGEPSWEKQARSGDLVVIVGGRVGRDGIHGATFSSEAMNSGSPATAVQIGDPITQKKLSDAIVKEARALDLYNSITDCGAGGISCSVAEMAKECGGCNVDLAKVPLKYPHLDDWEIWISESQERITLAVPPEKINQFIELMGKRGVEAVVIGEFTDSGRCIVKNGENIVMDLDMDFLHDGLPRKNLKTSYTKTKYPEPDFNKPQDLTASLLDMLSRPNIASFGFITHQYDFEVQGGSVLKPVQGKGDVNATASVTKPVLDSPKAVVCSQAMFPNYSEIDTYHMAACSINQAIGQNIATGGDIDYMALMDNFCWSSSDDTERLGQLKASARACYDLATAYGTPYISGKDSMFNDFKGFDKDGKEIKISVLPTLLISSLSVMEDATKAVSIDPKFPNDLIYLIGETFEELGGSEYFLAHNFIGNKVPQVNIEKSLELFKKFKEAIDQRLISSSMCLGLGGLGVALAKTAIAGQLGMEIDLTKVGADITRMDYLLFSESQSRFLITIAPEKQMEFEKHFANFPLTLLGKITKDLNFTIKNSETSPIIKTSIGALTDSYRKTFAGY